MLGALVAVMSWCNEPDRRAMLQGQRLIVQSIRYQDIRRKKVSERQCRSITVPPAQNREAERICGLQVRHDEGVPYVDESVAAPLECPIAPTGRAVEVQRDGHPLQLRKLSRRQHDRLRERPGKFQARLFVIDPSSREARDAEAWEFLEEALAGWEDSHASRLHERRGLLNWRKRMKSVISLKRRASTAGACRRAASTGAARQRSTREMKRQ